MVAQLPIPGHSGHHAVQFYNDSHRLCVSIADFLGDGVAAGQPLVVIATPEHRDGILAELKRRHFDVDRLMTAGDCALLDAQSTLDLFMDGDTPHPRRFRQAISAVLDLICKGREESVVRAYGEMVNLLWRAGNRDGAIRLEVLWNTLAMEYSFSLMCGYAMGPFYKQPAEIKDVCRHHTHSEILELGHA